MRFDTAFELIINVHVNPFGIPFTFVLIKTPFDIFDDCSTSSKRRNYHVFILQKGIEFSSATEAQRALSFFKSFIFKSL